MTRRARLCLGAAAGLLTAVALAATAQETAGPALSTGTVIAQSPILTIDQERLFAESAFGRAAVVRTETETAALAAENRRIEAALEQEERNLTAQRATMSSQDFAPLASAFDLKVEEIRTAQDAKARAISRQLEDDRQAFFEQALPAFGAILQESGAVALMDTGAVVLSLSAIDVTDEAIRRINLILVAPQAP